MTAVQERPAITRAGKREWWGLAVLMLPVLLISIDGLHPSNVLEADRYGLKIPTLRRLLREGADAPIETAKSYEQEVLFRLYSTEDGREGIEAFLDKREPRFRGA